MMVDMMEMLDGVTYIATTVIAHGLVICLGFGHGVLEKGRVKLGFSGLNFSVEVIYICCVCIFSFFEVLVCNGGGIEEDEVQEVFCPSVGVGGYFFCDHGVVFGDDGGVLVEGVF